MKRKTMRTAAAGLLTAALLLTGCGSEKKDTDAAAFVQPVSELAEMDLSGSNRYSGIVEASSIQKVKKSSKRKVSEVFVKVGDRVRKGARLFEYDTRSIQLEIDSAELEVEQLQANIQSYTNQIAELAKERDKASADKKLSYSIEIQEAELDRTEAEYNLKTKQQHLEKLRSSSTNTVVHAKISGVIQSIKDDDDDEESSGGDAFITILQTDSYRVKGTISETNIRSIAEDDEVTVISRLDPDETWAGTISKIDTDGNSGSNAEQDEEYGYGSNGGESTKYSFYVKLKDSDGLMMGQHVLISTGEERSPEEKDAMFLPSYYLVQEDGKFYVWAANKKDKLEKRLVTVGEYNEDDDSYPVLDGLTAEDYIAFPDETFTEGMSVSRYEDMAPDAQESEEMPEEEFTGVTAPGYGEESESIPIYEGAEEG